MTLEIRVNHHQLNSFTLLNIKYLIDNGWVVEAPEDEESHYQVAVAKDGTYEICIGMPINNLRPALSINDLDASSRVVERLVHLSKYQSVQALDPTFGSPQMKYI